MKRIAVLIGLLILMAGSTHAGQDAPRGTEGTRLQQVAGDAADPQGGPRIGPPPEAFKACEGKTEGSKAHFTGPEGDTVSGTCRIADGRLVLRPDRPRGEDREGRRGPPPEAYKACEGKSSGSQAQLIDPSGKTVKGTCEEQEDGKLALRPDRPKGERSGSR